jgi:hypothetical protein
MSSHKKLIHSIADKGNFAAVAFEGGYTSRLEYPLELPKAKIFVHIDDSDIFRAKEILRNHMCISSPRSDSHQGFASLIPGYSLIAPCGAWSKNPFRDRN